jgi:hypothetical protein
MDLIKPPNLSKTILAAYKFLRDSQIHLIIMDSKVLCDTIDKYIFYMNENYHMYEDRINNNFKNNKYTENIYNFEKLTMGKLISIKEKNLIIKFYEELIRHVDSATNSKYYCRKKLDKNDRKLIDETPFYKRMKYNCDIPNILVYVPKKIFNKEKFIDYSLDYSHTGLIGSIDESGSYFVIEFKNTNKNFYYCHIENVRYSCTKMVSFKIDYKLSHDLTLAIVFD